jgi:hypothetical protein
MHFRHEIKYLPSLDITYLGFTSVPIQIVITWVVKLCSVVDGYKQFLSRFWEPLGPPKDHSLKFIIASFQCARLPVTVLWPKAYTPNQKIVLVIRNAKHQALDWIQVLETFLFIVNLSPVMSSFPDEISLFCLKVTQYITWTKPSEQWGEGEGEGEDYALLGWYRVNRRIATFAGVLCLHFQGSVIWARF